MVVHWSFENTLVRGPQMLSSEAQDGQPSAMNVKRMERYRTTEAVVEYARQVMALFAILSLPIILSPIFHLFVCSLGSLKFGTAAG